LLPLPQDSGKLLSTVPPSDLSKCKSDLLPSVKSLLSIPLLKAGAATHFGITQDPQNYTYQNFSPVVVMDPCNPSTWRGQGRRIANSRAAWTTY
jgi:hypothetical protein